MRRIAVGKRVTVTGVVDPETNEATDQGGEIVSRGHVVDEVEHYEVQIDGLPFPSLVEVDRVTRE